MPRAPKAFVQTTLRLEPGLYEAAREVAERFGLPLNTWIAQTIRREIERVGNGG